MADFLEKFSETLATRVTALVIENVRRELENLHRESFVFCFSEEEAAEKLGVHPKTLYRMRKSGEISYSRSPSGKPVYLKHHIADYLLKHEVKNAR